MSNVRSHFQLDTRPIANEAAMIVTKTARFTILTSRLIRMEFEPNGSRAPSETGRFTDQASQTIWYREQPVPKFTVQQADHILAIETEHLQIRYELKRPFTPTTLIITLKENGQVYHFGDEDDENLLGTTRTLDTISGSTELDLGLMSRSGWAVIDDSKTLLFNEDGWLEPRSGDPNSQDIYFFGYGQDYATCLQDYCAIAGAVPLLPRWALGNWWSRYWAYDEAELSDLMRDFQAHNVPLSVCIIDMDWHLVDVGTGVNGWTGYSWNRDLFPDPPKFIAWLHEQGLKTALNLHPALGVRPHEEMYEEMARRVGADPKNGGTVSFDIANPTFANPYFELLHHPQEADGVDFWWMDWQQETYTGLPNLDPLYWLNHLHFYDLGREGSKRPFIFSRWGGYGNHRYPIGFSGDTHVNWESLAFQPYFTATAANVGYGWWSHDIGGHTFGVEEGELFARWVQFGLFSPILRLHSTNNPFHDRRPWGFDAEVEHVTRAAMQLRHAFIPYLYTMSWRNWQTAQPPIRPMYHDYPAAEAAYHCPHQYTFGTELIVAPYVEPAHSETGLSRQLIWLPEGSWTHFFTGETIQGGGWHVQYGNLRDMPLFAKAGAIVPLGPKVGWGGIDNPAALDVHIFAGANNEFTLYEDDGETTDYLRGEFGLMTFRQTWQEQKMVVQITAVSNPILQIPSNRMIKFHIHAIHSPEKIEVTVGETAVSLNFEYNAQQETMVTGTILLSATENLTLTLSTSQPTLHSRRDRLPEKVIDMLRTFKLATDVKLGLQVALPAIIADPNGLARFRATLSNAQMRALLELTQQAGVHHIRDTRERDLLILWNNRTRRQAVCTYQYSSWLPDRWHDDSAFRVEDGLIPTFRTLLPQNNWRCQVNYGNLIFGLEAEKPYLT